MTSGLERLLPSPEVLSVLLKRASPDQKVYLVGGAVRDALLGIANRDLDFAVSGEVKKYAQRVAGDLGGAFYMMDLKHQTARIVLSGNSGSPYFLDFSALHGDSIDSDLQARDFTINAMAIELVNPDTIIDPLGGAQNLKERVLRACGPTAFMDDPVRLLRAVRLSVAHQIQIESPTIQWMKESSSLLSSTSNERRRDEFFRILEGRQVMTAVRILDQFRLLELIVPEVGGLKTTRQSGPHTLDAWEHTLATLNWLENLFGELATGYSEDKTGNLLSGMASMHLGRYRNQFIEHFNSSLTPGRRIRGLAFLAALLHDIGKPNALSIDDEARTHFYQHEALGAEIAETRLRSLAFSNQEIEWVRRLVSHHMRIHQLALSGKDVSRRSIYRLFRDLGKAGIDLSFLSLADTLATYGVTISTASWEHELSICRRLMDAWFDQNLEIINPPRLVSGTDLIRHFSLEPGPFIGKLLAEIQEAQAAGQVNTVEEALKLANELIHLSSHLEERPHDGP